MGPDAIHDGAVAAMTMEPACGEQLVRFVGDQIRFHLKSEPAGHQAFLRTNIGRAAAIREGVIQSIEEPEVQLEACWRDVPMTPVEDGWEIQLALSEVGWFQSKCYTVDTQGRQVWPEGDDVSLSVQPNFCRAANIIYCAFPRMFGPNKQAASTTEQDADERIQSLDEEGYAVIPPSGTFRSLKEHLPHIFEHLGCKIVHLLPVNPTPTTFARMGRFGSPYACGDMTAVDPALVEFDQRTTGVEQFCELADAVHGYGGRVFVDLVVNHTGWGSTLQNEHPEWFLREDNGDFASPGAWGVTWGDLVELDPKHQQLWEHMAEAFMTWCSRGVDGFRCDAGYKVPMPVWRYIIARVRREYPNTVFLLEGLGGGWEQTEELLTAGGMQWAYSELFQEYNGSDVAGYLDHAHRQSQRVGALIHYSETHDNERLAARGRDWSLMRNRLCALTSVSGGFGFTNGVEWLADERVNVHSARGMNWGGENNIVNELASLNRLIATHPCFFDGATLERLSEQNSPVYMLKRTASDGELSLLVLVNTDPECAHEIAIQEGSWTEALSGQTVQGGGIVTLEASAVWCLSDRPIEAVADYLTAQARVAWALECLCVDRNPEQCGSLVPDELERLVNADPFEFLAGLQRIRDGEVSADTLHEAIGKDEFPHVSPWSIEDAARHMPLPVHHWLMVRGHAPFVVVFDGRQLESVETTQGFVAAFPPGHNLGEHEISIRRLQENAPIIKGVIAVVADHPLDQEFAVNDVRAEHESFSHPTVLLTNGHGAMSRMAIDMGRIQSKYDCLLGANLHADSPVDRHVFVKRARLWAVADGFISELNAANLLSFQPGPAPSWSYLVSAGDGRAVEVNVVVEMPTGENTIIFRVQRKDGDPELGRALEEGKAFSLTLRIDIEDRSFHQESHLTDGDEQFWSSSIFPEHNGFEFRPSDDRVLSAESTHGKFHVQPEWVRAIDHPLEETRGQIANGDAYSPGWFEIPLSTGEQAEVCMKAEGPIVKLKPGWEPTVWGGDAFSRKLTDALGQFVVSRGGGQTVIAGYPWFLDWGRDTFIAARGMLAAGWHEAVGNIVHTFAKLEKGGTLPNALHGDNDSNRETSDAPLWFGLVAEELDTASLDSGLGDGRSLEDVLLSIGQHYMEGTQNGIRMDPESGLIWSPSHYTWMDTNYPAGTPREGYPIEIQALWIRLLRQLAARQPEGSWGTWAQVASESLIELYTGANGQWLGDLLVAKEGQSARDAVLDDSLRCNALIPIALDVVNGSIARNTVSAAQRYLLIPGAMRTLAPLRTTVPLHIEGNDGKNLNDPHNPYWGRYEGDEDTQRKPAYHNGTAWGWPLGIFCEALVKAWDCSPASVQSAKSYLLSAEPHLNRGCIGHLPEIMDGDAPHLHRGCDAQAWSVSEVLRVWKWLNEHE